MSVGIVLEMKSQHGYRSTTFADLKLSGSFTGGYMFTSVTSLPLYIETFARSCMSHSLAIFFLFSSDRDEV